MELATTRNHEEVIELLNDYDKYKCAPHANAQVAHSYYCFIVTVS